MDSTHIHTRAVGSWVHGTSCNSSLQDVETGGLKVLDKLGITMKFYISIHKAPQQSRKAEKNEIKSVHADMQTYIDTPMQHARNFASSKWL